jgi:hypothetical protein
MARPRACADDLDRLPAQGLGKAVVAVQAAIPVTHSGWRRLK